MPIIDVYCPNELIAINKRAQVAKELSIAVFRAEGLFNPTPAQLNNSAVFIHQMAKESIATGTVFPEAILRIQITTPPNVITETGKKEIAKEVPAIIARISGDKNLVKRSWVTLIESSEGGWGVDGKAYWKKDIDAANAQPNKK